MLDGLKQTLETCKHRGGCSSVGIESGVMTVMSRPPQEGYSLQSVVSGMIGGNMGIQRNVYVVAAALLLSVSACQSREERVSEAVNDGMKSIGKEEQEAQREVGKAMDNRNETLQAVNEDVREKKLELDEAKIDATKEMANAERKVDDEKIEATEEIVDAEADARKDVEDAMKD